MVRVRFRQPRQETFRPDGSPEVRVRRRPPALAGRATARLRPHRPRPENEQVSLGRHGHPGRGPGAGRAPARLGGPLHQRGHPRHLPALVSKRPLPRLPLRPGRRPRRRGGQEEGRGPALGRPDHRRRGPPGHGHQGRGDRLRLVARQPLHRLHRPDQARRPGVARRGGPRGRQGRRAVGRGRERGGRARSRGDRQRPGRHRRAGRRRPGPRRRGPEGPGPRRPLQEVQRGRPAPHPGLLPPGRGRLSRRPPTRTCWAGRSRASWTRCWARSRTGRAARSG